jgi:hypothetical protein
MDLQSAIMGRSFWTGNTELTNTTRGLTEQIIHMLQVILFLIALIQLTSSIWLKCRFQIIYQFSTCGKQTNKEHNIAKKSISGWHLLNMCQFSCCNKMPFENKKCAQPPYIPCGNSIISLAWCPLFTIEYCHIIQ